MSLHSKRSATSTKIIAILHKIPPQFAQSSKKGGPSSAIFCIFNLFLLRIGDNFSLESPF